jgi:hypothetical protein
MNVVSTPDNHRVLWEPMKLAVRNADRLNQGKCVVSLLYGHVDQAFLPLQY